MNRLGRLALLVAALGCSSTGSDGSGGAGGHPVAGAGGSAAGSGGAAGAGGGTAGVGGPCTTDTDCVFNANAGCCGVCLAKTDTAPAPIDCDAVCGLPSSCLCIEGRCREGTLQRGQGCSESRSACGRNLICCRLCSPIPDGGGCGSPACTQPLQIRGAVHLPAAPLSL